MTDEKLKIITLTSWKKRLGNLPKVLDAILNQTVKPDKIVLNLSSEEFPKKDSEIPVDVLKYLNDNDIEIFWVDGKNTKQWKKIIPTLFRYPNDWVICIDDDRICDTKFIERLWNKHLKEPNEPITINKGYKVKGYLQHCGCGTLECMDFYGGFEGIDINEVAENFSSSDTFYNYVLAKNKHRLIPIDGADGSRNFNSVEPLSKSQGTCTPKNHTALWEWLEKKYGKIVKEVKPVTNKEVSKNIVTSMYGDVVGEFHIRPRKINNITRLKKANKA